jgi:hypothetical protein
MVVLSLFMSCFQKYATRSPTSWVLLVVMNLYVAYVIATVGAVTNPRLVLYEMVIIFCRCLSLAGLAWTKKKDLPNLDQLFVVKWIFR